MAFTEEQHVTLQVPDRRGLLFHAGDPCECGESADVSTKSVRKYSDTMLYKHRCSCGARWETWTEG